MRSHKEEKTVKKQGTDKRKKILYGILFGIFVLLSIFIFFYIGKPMIRFASEPEKFREWVDGHGVGGRFAYVGMILLQVVVAIIPGEPFEIAGGYAFGVWEGTFLCLAAASAGSFLVFSLVRKFGVRFVSLFFEEEKLEKLKFLKSSPRRDVIFFFIFMLPGTPKDLLSYFAGLTDMKFSTWALISVLGRIPSVVTSVVGGAAIGEKNYKTAVLVFLITFAVSVAGMLLYEYIVKKRSSNHTEK